MALASLTLTSALHPAANSSSSRAGKHDGAPHVGVMAAWRLQGAAQCCSHGKVEGDEQAGRGKCLLEGKEEGSWASSSPSERSPMLHFLASMQGTSPLCRTSTACPDSLPCVRFDGGGAKGGACGGGCPTGCTLLLLPPLKINQTVDSR